MSDHEDNPGVRVPPPFIFGAFFLAGLVMRRWVPVHIPHGRAIGVMFAISAGALLLWGTATMLRARTHIIPHKPATQLVTTGPFRFSRNPLYIAMTLAYLSASCWIDVVPAIVLLPFAVAVLQTQVIRREEAYLLRRFGDAYAQYCARVRRWM